MALPTSGGHDWIPTKPVEVTVLPPAITVEVTTLPPVIPVEVTVMPANITVEVTTLPAVIPVEVTTMPDSIVVDLPSSDVTANVVQSQVQEAIGVIKTMNGLGRIYLSDGFETGMGCWNVVYTNNALLWLTRDTRFQGLQSLAIHLPTNTATCYIERCTFFTSSNKKGMEVSFCFPSKYFILRLQTNFYNGITEYDIGIYLDFTTNQYGYINNVGVWTLMGGFAAQTINSIYWYSVKFTYDISTAKYILLSINGKIFDISAFNIKNVDTNLYKTFCRVQILGCVGMPANSRVFLDNIILSEEV